jgi:hypothetical protein
VKAYAAANAFLETVPADLLYSIIGLCLCFFGGNFPLTIAAAEAIRQCGYENLKKNLGEIHEELTVIKEASKEDDKVDADGDGIPDVEQITPTELVARKLHLYLTKTEDPNRMTNALGSIGTIFTGVIATLKLRFARTVSLGVSIGEQVLPLAMKWLLPILKSFVPEEYQQWLPTVVGFICKSLAVAIAWGIQRVVSAVQSALRGGLMFSRSGMKFLASKQLIKDMDPNTTYMDEAVGWGMAAIGFLFQMRNWFGLPFPFWLIMFPISMMESVLAYIVTWQ